MWRLFPGLKWFLGVVVLGLFLNAVASSVSQSYRDELTTLLIANWGWLLAGLLFLASIMLYAGLDWRRKAREDLAEGFKLCKSAERLTPSDLGFKLIRVNEEPDLQYRPYSPAYVKRRAVDYEQRDDPHPPREYSEWDLYERLEKGLSKQQRAFLLVGNPTDGKSRTIYELVRRMAGYLVVSPHWDRKVPDKANFSILKGRKVLLLVEDLGQHTSPTVDLLGFSRTLQEYASQYAILASCRGGTDMEQVLRATGSGVAEFSSNIHLRLSLRPLDDHEKARLAGGIGKDWDPAEADKYPTPGAITMADYLSAMRDRFSRLSSEHKAILRAMKLFDRTGVQLVHKERLLGVLDRVFDCRPSHIEDSLKLLTDEAFLKTPGPLYPIRAEAAYLDDAIVDYTPGRKPEDDLAALGDVLVGLRDTRGLFSLGVYYTELPDHPMALSCFKQALAIDERFPAAWYNKGVVLGKLGRDAEALAADEEAIRLRPDFPEAWLGKGVDLGKLGRFDEAGEAIEEAIRLRPDYPEAWYNNGVSLDKLGRRDEAIKAYDEAIRLRPDEPEAWYNKGVALSKLGRDAEALAAYDEAASELARGSPAS